MMHNYQFHDARCNRRGAMMPMLALMLPIVVILAAFAINIAYVELNRTELYISTDAASRAAGREFTITNNQAQARLKGNDAASRNTVGNTPLLLANSDYVFGESWRTGMANRYNFNAGGSRPNAVEITARRTATSPSGPLQLPFPSIFSLSSIEATNTARSNQVEVDIALVIDRSGSMAYGPTEVAAYPPLPASAPPGWWFCDAAPPDSRWLDAVNAVDLFLTELSASPMDESVSLSTYNSSAGTDQNLTTNYTLIRNSLATYTNSFCSGATNIGGGIDAGRNSLAHASAREWAAKVMIVLTDGIDTVGSDPIASATSAAGQKIMIFTITFSNEADQATMQQVAVNGNGKHYHTASGAGLAAIFQDIARQLPIMLTR